MDTLSHGLWATVVGKGVNQKSTKKIKLGWMAFWGMFPDLFAFIPVIVWMLWQIFFNGVDFDDIPRPETMPSEERNAIYVFRLTQTLYHFSHSIIVFVVIFLLVAFLYRYTKNAGRTSSNPLQFCALRFLPCWSLSGWFVHIVTDIPTHTRDFYPTLFLWPLSDWCYDGSSWGTMRFMLFNYTFLLMFFMLFWLRSLISPRKILLKSKEGKKTSC